MIKILSPAVEVEYDFAIDLIGSTLQCGDSVFSGDFGMSFDGVGVIEAISDTQHSRVLPKERIGYVKIYPKVIK